MEKEYEIFISSKSEDYFLAEQVYNYLAKYGYTVFLASMELQKIGESAYSLAVDSALDKCTHMIVVSSSIDHIKSKWVQYEWNTFSNDVKSGYKAGNLITILTDNVELKLLPASLRHQQSFGFDTYRNSILGYLPLIKKVEHQESKIDNADNDSMIGSTIYGNFDVYRIVELIGEGKTGKVYKCYSENSRIEYAVKKLEISDLYEYESISLGEHNVHRKPTLNEIEEWKQIFMKTSLSIKEIHQENLPQLYDYIEDVNGNAYCIMDYIKGHNLQEYIMKHPLSEEDALNIIKDVCKALRCLHTAGVLHLDVKPSNIIYNPELKKATLVDFTTSVYHSSINSISKIWITPSYIPAEISRYNKINIDLFGESLDTYSVAATFFTLLTNEIPPNDMNYQFVKDSIKHSLSKIKTSQPIIDFLQYAMGSNPDSRFQSVNDMFIKLNILSAAKLSKTPKYSPLIDDEISERNKRGATTVLITSCKHSFAQTIPLLL